MGKLQSSPIFHQLTEDIEKIPIPYLKCSQKKKELLEVQPKKRHSTNADPKANISGSGISVHAESVSDLGYHKSSSPATSLLAKYS